MSVNHTGSKQDTKAHVTEFLTQRSCSHKIMASVIASTSRKQIGKINGDIVLTNLLIGFSLS